MSSKSLIYKYPLDLTGEDPNNLVTNEPHELKDAVNRVIVPNNGAFYSESVKVRDLDAGESLTQGQFKCVNLYQEATEKSGLEVTTFIVITDEMVNSNVEIDYQVIGGEFSYSAASLRDIIDAQEIEDRPVDWENIVDKPAFYPPSFHLHDIGDVYGFEYLVEALNEVRQAILVGNEGSLEELRQHINLVESRIQSYLREIATTDEAKEGESDEVVVTPLKAKQSFDHWSEIYLINQSMLETLNSHLVEDDPHETRAEDLNLGDLYEKELMTLEQAHDTVVTFLGGSERYIQKFFN